MLTWYPSHAAAAGRRSTPSRRSSTRRATGSTGRTSAPTTATTTRRSTSRCSLLKALTYAPTGGIVAAPTTSLPEWIGGVRNWDYRFCWLRDATLTLLAMLQAGYSDEAVAWREWLLRAVAGDPGRRADHVRHRRRAAPRRARARVAPRLRGLACRCGSGNAASTQLQLDVYGEVLDAALPDARARGAAPTTTSGRCSRKLLDWLEDGWRLEDAGIWEVRGPPRHFTHSKVMAWVAFDRAVRMHEEFGRDGPGRALARAARRDQGRGPRARLERASGRPSRSRTARTSSTRASLLMPLVGFLPANDARVRLDASRRSAAS